MIGANPVGPGAGQFGFAGTFSSAANGGGNQLIDVPAAFLQTLVEGSTVWVSSVRDSYTWYPTDTDTADQLLIVKPTVIGTNPGRFVRNQIASARWTTQMSWYIDPSNVAANDENSGIDAAHPLKTGMELYRRTKTLELGPGIINIYIISDINLPDALMLEVTANELTTLLIHGSATPGHGKTVLYTSAGITAKTDQAQATNVRSQMTDAGVPTGTWSGAGFISTSALPNKRIRFTSGARTGCICWPQKDNTAGKVFTSAIIDVTPFLTGPTLALPTRQNLVGGEAFVLEALVQVQCMDLHIRRRDDLSVNTQTVGATIESVAFTGFTAVTFRNGDHVHMVGCVGVTLGGFSSAQDGEPAFMVTGCHANGMNARCGSIVSVYGCHLTGAITSFPGSNATVGLSTIAQGVPAIQVNSGSRITVACAASFDSSSSGFRGLDDGGMLDNESDGTADAPLLWGSGSTRYGCDIRPGDCFEIGEGVATPICTGSLGDFHFAGATQARAFDEGAGAYTALRNCTWALFATTVAGGGFGGNAHDVTSNSHLITQVTS